MCASAIVTELTICAMDCIARHNFAEQPVFVKSKDGHRVSLDFFPLVLTVVISVNVSFLRAITTVMKRFLLTQLLPSISWPAFHCLRSIWYSVISLGTMHSTKTDLAS